MKNKHMDSETAPLFSISVLGKRKKKSNKQKIKKTQQAQASSPNRHICFHGFSGFHGYGNIVWIHGK